MSTATENDQVTRTAGAALPGWRWLAWLPIAVLLVAIIVARAAGRREAYEFPNLRLLLSSTFYTLVSLGTLLLIARSFLATGAPGLLLLECGVILWSLAGTVGDAVFHGDANINITIFNIGIALAGMCHLVGSILMQRPQRVLRAKRRWLAAACALALGALCLLTWATLRHRLPVFFIQGRGGTPLRYWVLSAAIAMFVLSAGLLHAGPRATRPPFTSWYVLALLSLAVGLFGIMIQLSLGSVVNWLARTAEWLGGVYLLLAALAALRDLHLPLLPLADRLRPAYYRHAVAVVAVLVATALRLVFLAGLGTQSLFVTFYPAVIVAAVYGGLSAGLLATVLSVVVADYFWIAPLDRFTIGQPADRLTALIFLASGTMIAWITEAMLRAHQQTVQAQAKAKTAEERSRAAEALRESEERFRAVLDNSRDCIYRVNVQTGRYDYISPAVATMVGYTPAELMALDAAAGLAMIHPDDLLVYQAAVAQLEFTGQAEAQYRQRGKDGEYRWLSNHLSLAWDGQCRPLYRHGNLRDITANKRAEAVLRESEERFRTLFMSVSEGFYVAEILYDAAGQPCDYRYLDVNPAFELMLDLPREQIIGKRYKEIVPADQAVDWLQTFAEVAQTGRAAGVCFYSAAFHRHFEVVAFRPMAGQFAVLVTDITARKLAEEACSLAKAASGSGRSNWKRCWRRCPRR